MSKHQPCKIRHTTFCDSCSLLHELCICRKWTVKENAQSISICWTGKVIAKILHRRMPPDEALANANYIVNACNYYHKIALKTHKIIT